MHGYNSGCLVTLPQCIYDFDIYSSNFQITQLIYLSPIVIIHEDNAGLLIYKLLQSLLTDPNPASPANIEAAHMYQHDIQAYNKFVNILFGLFFIFFSFSERFSFYFYLLNLTLLLGNL